jgi:hypothetical protein
MQVPKTPGDRGLLTDGHCCREARTQGTVYQFGVCSLHTRHKAT